MAKLKLEFDYEIDFLLLGISCHLPDYRLAWILNKELKIDLERQKDIDLQLSKKSHEKGFFSCFNYDNEESYTTINLIANRCDKGFFCNELKQLDYFLQLWLPDSDEKGADSVLDSLKKNSQIITCVKVDTEKLKSKNNFIF